MNFIRELFALFDQADRRSFALMSLLLLFNGFLSLLGLGVVIPFVGILTAPDKIMSYHIFSGYTYQTVVTLCILGFLLSFIIKNVVGFFAVAIQTRMLNEIAAKITKKLFQQYMYAPYRWHLHRSTPTLIRSINHDVPLLSNYVIQAFGMFLREVLTVIIIFFGLLYLDFAFTMVVGTVLGISMVFFSRYTREKAYFYERQRASAWANMTNFVLQGVGGIKETKIYQREPYFLNAFNHQADRAGAAYTFEYSFQQAPRFLLEMIIISVVLLMLYVAIHGGKSGTDMIILMSVFGVAAVQLLPCMNRLMVAVASMRSGQPALAAVHDQLCVDPPAAGKSFAESPQSNMTFQDAIKLSDIAFSYDNQREALRDISLTIKRGQSVAFVGPSGAGKSTLVDLILGLYQPQGGKIVIDDQALDASNLSAWQQHFGYIPQQIYLYDGSIRENIAVGHANEEIEDAAVWEALEIAQLADFVRDQADGLDTFVGENGIRLSGGQRQRIGIARALFHRPDILVMDEATAALDNATELELTRAIDVASESRTLITIAHRLSTIEHYDVIYVLSDGQIVSQGSYQSLSDSCPVFQSMVADANKR